MGRDQRIGGGNFQVKLITDFKPRGFQLDLKIYVKIRDFHCLVLERHCRLLGSFKVSEEPKNRLEESAVDREKSVFRNSFSLASEFERQINDVTF